MIALLQSYRKERKIPNIDYNTIPLERDKHITMMGTPEDWPRWPILPLKRGPFTNQEIAVLADLSLADLDVFTVYLISMFERITPSTPKLTYASLDGVYDDGWRVD